MPYVVNWDVRADEFNRGDALAIVLGTDDGLRYDFRIERGMPVEEVVRRLRHLEHRLLDAARGPIARPDPRQDYPDRGWREVPDVRVRDMIRTHLAEDPPSLEEGESYE